MDKLLGVKVSNLAEDKILEKVKLAIDNKQKLQIVTLNTEMLMAAQKDPRLKSIINKAEIVVPESAGIYLAENYLIAKKSNKVVRLISSILQTISGKTGALPTRLSGVDLSYSLAGLCAEHGYQLLLLGGADGVADRAAESLRKQFVKLNVRGIYGGEVALNKGLVAEINQVKPDVIFVAFGHGKQEKWLSENLKNIPASVGIGVGGTLDYFANEVTRAPKFMQRLGLEWLFRLAVQPRRIKRQTSLIEFIQTLLKTN